MAGLDELMKQESVFMKALPQTTQFSVEDINLSLQNSGGQIELLFMLR